MRRRTAITGWRLARLTALGVEDAWVPTTVPGSVHTDLLSAGLIRDPYVGQGEADSRWVCDADWRYEVAIEVAASGTSRLDLVADGLDTDATLRINGVEFAHTRNQHRSYRFDLAAIAGTGRHRLSIDFASPIRSARDFEARAGAMPMVGDAAPYNAIRKMACSFGSDWGPHLPTSGIWKPIALESWHTARLDVVRPDVRVDDDGSGKVSITVRVQHSEARDAPEVPADVTRARPLTVRVRLVQPDGTVCTSNASVIADAAAIELFVPSPELWWPRGYGGQPLSRLEVELHGEEILDAWYQDVGFRRVEVRSQPDEHGVSFQLVVNGQPILVKGANWTPDDFLRPIAGADYGASLNDAVEANVNLLRVWGGGIFESDDFYGRCDRLGIMVWQDFLFSCACYSEAEEMVKEIAAEARENIIRLAPHPSLVIWNGGNETDEGYHDWGFRERLGDGVPWGDGYFRRLLPELLAELDPGRPYLPSSPFSSRDPSVPTEPSDGTTHSWKVWYSRDYTAYADSVPRFVAEFGFLGAPAFSTLERALDGEPADLSSASLVSHQKADDGFGRLERGWTPHLSTPANFDDWHFTTQLNQARAVRFGIEHFRSHWPRTTGTIMWQLKDCWPVIGYAAVDGDRHRKPLWHAIRSIYADRVLMLVQRDGALALVAGNDADESWIADVRVQRRAFDGTELASQMVRVDVDARSGVVVSLDPAVATGSVTEPQRAAWAVTAEADGAERAYWYPVEDVAGLLPAAAFNAQVDRRDGGYRMTVRALTLIKDLVLQPDRLDPGARVDRALVTLFPHETAVFDVHSTRELDQTKLVIRPVLRCANDLVKG